MKTSFAFRIFQIAAAVIGFLLIPVILWRAIIGKEDPKRLKERWGMTKVLRPAGRLVWIHGASVGESMLALSLADKMIAQAPDLSFLFTSGTRTSALMMMDRMGAQQYHQYLPIDTPGATVRFLRHWQPDMSVFLESELWPNLIFSIKKANIPLALVNARMNQSSQDRWNKATGIFTKISNQFDFVSAADQATADFFGQYVNEISCRPGNLKFLQPAESNETKVEQTFLRDSFGRSHIWLAASTHEWEEQALLIAHQQVLKTIPDALLILVPRHPERADQIATLCQKIDLTSTRWTRQKRATGNVLIADTIGEMSRWICLSDAVFMGGSLGTGKGHNPLEAARMQKPIITGQFVESFKGVYQELIDHKAVQMVEGPKQIPELVVERLQDVEGFKKQGTMAKIWIHATSDDLVQRIVTPLLALIRKNENETT